MSWDGNGLNAPMSQLFLLGRWIIHHGRQQGPGLEWRGGGGLEEVDQDPMACSSAESTCCVWGFSPGAAPLDLIGTETWKEADKILMMINWKLWLQVEWKIEHLFNYL